MLRRRPHSWNGDEEELKKCAAIECLLSATDDDQWPVEKLVDELCTRLKLLQLEQGAAGAAIAKQRWAGLGSSAPDCFECPSSDSDSFTSVSSPEVDQDNYHHDFPPLECLSDSDQVVLSIPLPKPNHLDNNGNIDIDSNYNNDNDNDEHDDKNSSKNNDKSKYNKKW